MAKSHRLTQRQQ